MAKVINLKAQEEITSVVERLWETGEDEVYLVLPKSSTLLKNIIALKLLKREADRLGKEVILVTKEPVGREMAKRVGLASKAALPKSALEESAEEEDEQEVFKDVPAQKFETMLEDEVKARREAPSGAKRFSDIRPKNALLERRSLEIEQTEEKVSLPIKDELPAEELVGEEKGGLSFLEKLQRKYQAEAAVSRRDKETEAAEDLADEEQPEEELPETEEEEISFGDSAKSRRHFWRWPVLSWRPRFKFPKLRGAFKIKKIKPTRQSLNVPIFSGKFLGLFGGVVILVAALALYFILPKAEITIVPKAEAVDMNLSVTADKSVNKIDAAQNKLPAQLIKLDKRQSQEFSTTGERQVNDKAKGVLTIYNEYSSSPQALVEKTRFVAEGGQVFRLTRTIVVPGAKIQEGKIVASSIDAEVVADQAGAEYNIGPSRFTIPGFQGTAKYAAFYGLSKAAMSGGASGLMKVLSQSDYDKAKADLWQSLQPVLDSEFKSQLPSELKIVDGAMKEEMSGAESSVAVGAPAEKFTLTLKGTAMAILFDGKDVLDLVDKKLADKLDDDKSLVLPDGGISYELVSADFTRGQAMIKLKVSGQAIWKVDTDALQKEIAGQNEKAIRDIFARHGEVNEARVVFWPFWVSGAPQNLDKVIIQIAK